MRCLASIPPVLRGESLASSDASGLQRRVIHSWQEAGFRPTSINTPQELVLHPEHEDLLLEMDVDLLVVPPSAGNYPAYLPNLRASLLQAADHYPEEVLAITNADIHISLSPQARTSLENLEGDQFFLAHRTDVEDDSLFLVSSPRRREMGLYSPFLPGIDFIAARTQTFREACEFLSPHLTIGLPWWDLLLPVSLFAVGATRNFLESEQFLHIQHQERWDPRWLNQVGKPATRYLNQKIKGYQAPASAYVWSLAYGQLMSPLQAPSVYKSRLLNLLRRVRGEARYDDALLGVLRMTEAMVCRQGWDLDSRWIGHWHERSPQQRFLSKGSGV